MRVVIAPDKYKDSATAQVAAEAMARGVRAAVPDAEVDLCPLADGGEGTVEALLAAAGGERRRTWVTGPLGTPVEAEWAVLADGAAVIEMAAAAGLALVPPGRRDPARTTTFGVGELIRDALDAGVSRIVVGVGGSGTVDGGVGAAQALGVDFRLEGPSGAGSPSSRPLNGGDLRHLVAAGLNGVDPRLAVTDLAVACDVTNPLLGPNGAAAVYAPQKGANPEQVEMLEAGLAHLAVLAAAPGTSLHLAADTPGAGAAGGLAFGLAAFFGARLVSGIDVVLAQVGFAERLRGADLVLTGEGRLDGQSLQGKTCVGVARAARAVGVPAMALVGSVGPGAERAREEGLVAVFSMCDAPMVLEHAMRDVERLLEAAAHEALSLVAAFAER
ncbi:MAG: glycerate kinase [Deltaproteobacteria bacterium]|nr:glycerate kinase [Deltaproteobacteria bacterium]